MAERADAAAGHGRSVAPPGRTGLVIVNTGDGKGKTTAARTMGVEIIPLGAGFTWLSQDLERDRATALACWALCRERIERGAHDVVILDELTYPLSFGWPAWEEVQAVLSARDPRMHVIITGRDAIPALIAYADLVTEMREIKHPYQRGIKTQPGIEF